MNRLRYKFGENDLKDDTMKEFITFGVFSLNLGQKRDEETLTGKRTFINNKR